MKRFFVLLFILIAVALSAQPILIVSLHPTLSWTAVTKDASGVALPAGGVMTYNVMWQPVGGGPPVLLINVAQTSATVNLTAWQVYDLGVQAVYVYQGNTYVSAIDWGSVGGTPLPFIVSAGAGLSTPAGLNIVP